MEQQEGARGAQRPSRDIGSGSLFEAHIAMIQLEQQGLWQRYTAMLIAEAIILGSFGWVQAPTALQVYFISGFGLALCTAWFVSTVSGYRLLVMRLDAASQFAWAYLTIHDEYANPLSGIKRRYGHKGGWIVGMALCVIGLFMLAHAFVLTHHLYYRFLFFEGPR